MIPQLWDEHPDTCAVVHCGVGNPHCLYLERRARSGPYIRPDNLKQCPDDGLCKSAGRQEYRSTVDIDAVIRRVRSARPNVLLSGSENAGLYLCEYSLYTSLQRESAPTVFLHLPPYGMPYSHEELCEIVHLIIKGISEQLHQQQGPPVAVKSAPQRPKVRQQPHVLRLTVAGRCRRVHYQ